MLLHLLPANSEQNQPATKTISLFSSDFCSTVLSQLSWSAETAPLYLTNLCITPCNPVEEFRSSLMLCSVRMSLACLQTTRTHYKCYQHTFSLCCVNFSCQIRKMELLLIIWNHFFQAKHYFCCLANRVSEWVSVWICSAKSLRTHNAMRQSYITVCSYAMQQHNASEVTTLWRYTNLFIIIIIITKLQKSKKQTDSYHWFLHVPACWCRKCPIQRFEILLLVQNGSSHWCLAMVCWCHLCWQMKTS